MERNLDENQTTHWQHTHTYELPWNNNFLYNALNQSISLQCTQPAIHSTMQKSISISTIHTVHHFKMHTICLSTMHTAYHHLYNACTPSFSLHNRTLQSPPNGKGAHQVNRTPGPVPRRKDRQTVLMESKETQYHSFPTNHKRWT